MNVAMNVVILDDHDYNITAFGQQHVVTTNGQSDRQVETAVQKE